MKTTLKRIAQGAILLILLAYMTQVIRPLVSDGFFDDDGARDGPRRPDHKRSRDGGAALTADRLYLREKSRKLSDGRSHSNDVLEEDVEVSSGKSAAKKVFDDIFISVKTTKNFHKSRLDIILKTWFSSAKDQTYFFTDAEDDEYQRRTGGHLINTNCTSSHNRKALCCKMSVEFDTFMETNKMWFCHFDDDNYVNVPRLVELLQKYNPQEDWYLGKPSIRAPLRIMNRDNPQGAKISFWFATGGAGFCISRALALKMMPMASNGKFISVGDKIRLPDDVTMGYIIEHVLKHNLTVIKEFHSHLEPMKFIQQDTFAQQITFSYSRYGKELNVITIDGITETVDPTRFLSLHCHIFPSFSYCPR